MLKSKPRVESREEDEWYSVLITPVVFREVSESVVRPEGAQQEEETELNIKLIVQPYWFQEGVNLVRVQCWPTRRSMSEWEGNLLEEQQMGRELNLELSRGMRMKDIHPCCSRWNYVYWHYAKCLKLLHWLQWKMNPRWLRLTPFAIMGEFAAVCENSCQAMLACTVTLHGILWEIIAATE